MIDLPKTIIVTKFTPPNRTWADDPLEHKQWPTQTHDPVQIPEQPDPIPQREHGPFWRGTHE